MFGEAIKVIHRHDQSLPAHFLEGDLVRDRDETDTTQITLFIYNTPAQFLSRYLIIPTKSFIVPVKSVFAYEKRLASPVAMRAVCCLSDKIKPINLPFYKTLHQHSPLTRFSVKLSLAHRYRTSASLHYWRPLSPVSTSTRAYCITVWSGGAGN